MPRTGPAPTAGSHRPAGRQTDAAAGREDGRSRSGRLRAAAPGSVTALLAIAIAFAMPGRGFAQDVGLAIGTIPPAAQVEDLDGNAVDLSRFAGRQKPVLFEFWATWCPLCKALEPRLQAARRQFGERVVFVVVAVAVNETPRRIRRHLESNETVGPVFFDAKGAAVRAFDAPTTSYVVILDAAGKVAYTGTGSDQPIAEALGRILGGTAR